MSQNSTEISEKLLSGEYVLYEKSGKSKIWKLYAKIMNKDGEEVKNYVYCRNCEKVLKYNNIQTSNFHKHRCYNEKFKRNADNTTSEIEVETPTLQVVENPVNTLTKLLTRWILKDCRPHNLIQNEGLKAVFKEIASLGSTFGSDLDLDRLLPTSSAVEKHVSKIYEQCFERVKAEVDLIKGKGFGLTAHIRTDSFTKQIYIALTIHYLKNGVLTSHLLGIKSLESKRSTNQNIAEKLQEILERFDCKLSSKSILVTNGDFDISKALPNTQNLPCISQLLSNALQKSVEEVPEVEKIINACLKLVNYLKKMELNTPLEGLMQTSCSNRWQTICKMLSSLNSKWDEIEKILRSKNASSHILTINKHHLKAVTKVFQPFEEAIEILEDDSYATLHIVIVYLHELKKSCRSEFEFLDFIETLKENIRFYLEKIFTENVKTLHKLALFLYPPTNKLVQFSDQDKKCVEDECISLMKCFKNELKPIIKQESESPITPLSKRRKLFTDFVNTETNCDPNEAIMQEIQYYKSTRVVNSADFDAFSWWELQKDNFPLLYKLSCLILATPASNAASRRIFSNAGSLLYAKSKLGSQEMEIEKNLFIKFNAKHDELDGYFSA